MKPDDSISKLEGRDKVGVTGEVLSTLAGVATGTAAAGTLAAAAGVTTIPVVTTAASWIGLTVLSATPIGWVAGVGIAAGGIAYGLGKLILSGGKQDQIRSDLIARLKKIHESNSHAVPTAFDPQRLEVAIKRAIDAGLDPATAERLITLVAAGKLDSELAIKRLEAVCN
jgi:hypothetical protein